MRSVKHILSGECFIRPTDDIIQIALDEWSHVRCYHTTRLRDPGVIRKRGLRIPTDGLLTELLSEAGLSNIDQEMLRLSSDENGRRICLHLSEPFLLGCDYHLCGSEKLRKYAVKAGVADYSVLMQRVRTWVPIIVRLTVPIPYVEESLLADSLVHSQVALDYLDVTIESAVPIPPEYVDDVVLVQPVAG